MPVLKQLFASPDEDMRASAVNGVARVHTPEAVALLERDPPTCCLVGNESGASDPQPLLYSRPLS
jgi:hypothetical protein